MDPITGKAPYAGRFHRARGDRGVVINERDKEILRHLYRTRLLTTEQLGALVVPGTPGVPQGLVRRLRRLYDAGFVDRPRQQTHHLFDVENGRYQGLRPLVYGLGTRGAEVVAAEHEDARAGRLRWEKRNREITSPMIEHALMVAQIYAVLQLAIRKGGVAELLFWEEGSALKDVFFTDRDEQHVPRPTGADSIRRRIIYPDVYFGLGIPGRVPGTRDALYFFVEADRSTMTTERFLRKLKDFWRWGRLGLHTKTFGIQHFLVLTVTRSHQRRDSLRLISRDADDRKIGSGLFRFATLDNFPLDKAWQFFGHFWLTPNSDKPTDIFS
jgi:hypothetical protein